MLHLLSDMQFCLFVHSMPGQQLLLPGGLLPGMPGIGPVHLPVKVLPELPAEQLSAL